MIRAPIPFGGAPLDRADAIRGDPEKLAALRHDGVLLRLDGLLPELAGDALASEPVPAGDAELVFLGLREGRAVFAAVPPHGNTEPAYAQRHVWDILGLLAPAELAL